MEGVEGGEGGGQLLGQLGRERGHLDQWLTGIGQMFTEAAVERVTETQSFTGVDLQRGQEKICQSQCGGRYTLTCIQRATQERAELLCRLTARHTTRSRNDSPALEPVWEEQTHTQCIYPLNQKMYENLSFMKVFTYKNFLAFPL